MTTSSVKCILLIGIFFLVFACTEEKAEISSPPLGDHTGWIFFNTLGPEIVCHSRANVWGLIEAPGDKLIVDYGHCWDTLPAPDTTDNHTSFGSIYGGDAFSSYLTNLNPATQYYFRIYLIISQGIIYGETLDFTTLSPTDTLDHPECGPY